MILFRGKRVSDGKWVQGYYACLPDAAGSVHMIFAPAENPDESNQTCYIDPNTVGQYTGLTDKNGERVFDGDIIKTGSAVSYVYWDEKSLCWSVYDGKADAALAYYESYEVEVIGNVCDNPELLEAT